LFSSISLVGVPLGGISQRLACRARHAAISSNASPGVCKFVKYSNADVSRACRLALRAVERAAA